MKTTTGMVLLVVLTHVSAVFVESPDSWQIEKGRVYCVIKQNICLCNYDVIVMTVNCFPGWWCMFIDVNRLLLTCTLYTSAEVLWLCYS